MHLFLIRFISLNITKLRLNGFKSFVDPTEFEILPGLTGVVGPNGCGKSNLLDALRWVMGENKPTSMRGDGMDDVIFSGTSLRSARSYAEVNLQIEILIKKFYQSSQMKKLLKLLEE